MAVSIYGRRGSHYWTTPAAGGKVDKVNLTQFGRAIGQLGIAMIPADRHRYHYVKAKVNVLRYTDNTLAIHHGPRELARYDANGQVLSNELPVAA